MKLYFRVKYGHNNVDYVSIEEKELEKTIYAKLNGSVIQLGNKFIDGKHIYAIEPDCHKYTGWIPQYEPRDADDYAQIERDCPPELMSAISRYTERVNFLIHNRRVHEIGKNVRIPELDTNYEERTALPFGERRRELTTKFTSLLDKNVIPKRSES